MGAGIALLAACGATGRANVPPSPGTPPPSAMAKVCQDYADIKSAMPPILDRLANGAESSGQYMQDELVIDGLSQRLYADASAFARVAGSRVFELSNRLSVDLNHLVYGYFMFTDPSQVDASDVAHVGADLAAIDEAMAAGEFTCASHQ